MLTIYDVCLILGALSIGLVLGSAYTRDEWQGKLLEKGYSSIECIPDSRSKEESFKCPYISKECIPCCDFCAHADPCEHEEDGAIVNEYVMCHVKNEKVWIGGGCDEHFKCRYCDKENGNE